MSFFAFLQSLPFRCGVRNCPVRFNQMQFLSSLARHVGSLILLGATFTSLPLCAQSNLAIRVMAANTTSGNSQSYEGPGIRIFQGLKPDIVAVQEFRYNSSASDEQLRLLVDTAFGTNFYYYREPYTGGGDIPNGIISRWPFLATGSEDDTNSPNRGFAWALIDLPGTNELYVVSVHLLTANSSTRALEAAQLKAFIQSRFLSNVWVIVGGDMNTANRGEAAIDTFKTFLSDEPVPSDGRALTNATFTNAGRTSPYDYVLPSFSLTNYLIPVVLTSHTFPNGLVFDSRQYATLSDVAPVLANDSGAVNMQHMAVIKDFLIPVVGTTTPPSITTHPQSQTNSIGANVTFNVVAAGTPPLAYQWRFNGANLSSVTTDTCSLTNIQATNAGNYAVVVTNSFGSVTSEVATLTVITAPTITNHPKNLTVTVGEDAVFTVGALGTPPLVYQWRFNTTNILGATSSSYIRSNAQPADAGNYSVVVANSTGQATSSNALLTVNPPTTANVIAQWNFNSVPPDAATTTGSTAPSIGSGIASLVTALTPTFAGGSSSDSATSDNSGWNTTGYPSATNGNKTAGVRFDVSTVGQQNVVVRWDQRVSNTGSRYSRLQYTTNGTTFLDYPSSVSVVAATTFEAHTNSLSGLPGVNNNSNFAFRIVNEFENTATGSGANGYVAAMTGSSYGSMGTTRFDMVTLLADSIPSNPPAVPPTLTNVSLSGNYFHFVVSGSTGSNYIVQAATDLSLSNWVSLQTNAAPVFFSETNQFQQRFYRGLIAP